MNILIDIIGAVIICGLLMLTIFAVNGNVSSFTLKNQMDLVSEENLSTMATMIDSDLRKIGYGWGNPSTAIIPGSCDSTRISFRSDIDNNGAVEIVSYSIGTTSQLGATLNPRDFKLIRQAGNQQTSAALGLTTFRLKYYNALGQLLSYPITTSLVKGIEVSLKAEGTFPVDTSYAWTTVVDRVYPINLRVPN
jgi:hypothetical protein